MKKSLARSGSAIVVLAGLLATAPAMAFTHHPSTAAERAQTKQLNEQALAQAQGQAPTNMQASNTMSAPPAVTSDSNVNMNTSPQQPMSNDESSQPASPQTPAPDQKPATAPSNGQ